MLYPRLAHYDLDEQQASPLSSIQRSQQELARSVLSMAGSTPPSRRLSHRLVYPNFSLTHFLSSADFASSHASFVSFAVRLPRPSDRHPFLQQRFQSLSWIHPVIRSLSLFNSTFTCIRRRPDTAFQLCNHFHELRHPTVDRSGLHSIFRLDVEFRIVCELSHQLEVGTPDCTTFNGGQGEQRESPGLRSIGHACETNSYSLTLRASRVEL